MSKIYTKKVYKKSPSFLQNAFVTARGIIYTKVKKGSRYRYLEKELLVNEKLTLDELKSLQIDKLKDILSYAYKHIPFYRKLFDEKCFHPWSLKNPEDINKLPLLTKQIISEHYRDFIPSLLRRKFLFKGTTTGTTGSPLTLYMNRELAESERAFVERQYRWAGWDGRGRIASFVGDIIVPVEQSKPPFWRYDAYSKEMLFSTYHMSESTLGCYIDKLYEFNPVLLTAYPSTLFLLAKYAQKHGMKISIPALRGIVANSETLYGYQERLIEKIFGKKVFNLYGHFERVIKIGTCEHGGYHIFPDYGFTEFLFISKDNGNSLYELVGTGFINKAMPLIRYRTGDIVTLSERECECGRHFPLVGSILGRSNDAIITPEGRIVVMVDNVFKDIEHIRMAQIHQNNLQELLVLVEPESGFNPSDEKKIISNLSLRVGHMMKIAVKRTRKIPSLRRAKYKLIVSHLNNNQISSLIKNNDMSTSVRDQEIGT